MRNLSEIPKRIMNLDPNSRASIMLSAGKGIIERRRQSAEKAKIQERLKSIDTIDKEVPEGEFKLRHSIYKVEKQDRITTVTNTTDLPGADNDGEPCVVTKKIVASVGRDEAGEIESLWLSSSLTTEEERESWDFEDVPDDFDMYYPQTDSGDRDAVTRGVWFEFTRANFAAQDAKYQPQPEQ